jgi:hypothetical protein
MRTGIVDTGGKFTAGVNATDDSIFPEIFVDHGDTVDQFATGVNDDGGKLPPVSTPLAVNCHRCQ